MNFRQVHLDFHTSEAIEGIGSQFQKEQFQEMLKLGHVNSITVFSKCHHGWAYHPSEANEMHPHLSFDLLGSQIEAAHEIGVKTPVYLSAGLDEKAFRKHPEWWYIGELDGKPVSPDLVHPGFHVLCFNTGYLEYLAKQVEEVVQKYDADGIFLDISAPRPCYCKTCQAELIREGKDPTDRRNVWEQAQRVYNNYTKRIEEAVYKYKKLPIFHNGGHIARGRYDIMNRNSHLEIESLPTGGWGYDDAQISTRYAQTLGRDYLSMTGRFHGNWGEFGGYKTANALWYEAAASVALGAKISVGDQLHPNGKMDHLTYENIGKAYEKIEKAEPWLTNVKYICDIGVLSSEAYGVENQAMDLSVFSKYDIGVSRILNEGKYLYQFLDYEADFSKYKLIILPDVITLSEKLKKKLSDFVKNGGKILATGRSGLDENNQFAFRLGAEYVKTCEYEPTYADAEELGLPAANYVMYQKSETVRLSDGCELVKKIRPYFNRTNLHFCSHQHAPSSGEYLSPGMTEGADGIYCSWQLFANYATDGSSIYKKLAIAAIDRLLEKTLETNLYQQGIVSLAKQENRYVMHMLYASPAKRGSIGDDIEDLPEIWHTDFSVRLPEEKISSVTLVPQMEKIPYTFEDGILKFQVEKFTCHQMVEIQA